MLNIIQIKRRAVILICVVCAFTLTGSALAEHRDGSTQVRPVANDVVQQAINDVLSACQPGRGGSDPSIDSGINDSVFGDRERVEQTNGSAVFKATCLKCHQQDGFQAQLSDPTRVEKFISAIESGRMPKAGYAFVGNEKDTLLEYLRGLD